MIHLVIPSIPPSSNHAYFHRGPVRTLTTIGRKYKAETTAHLAQSYRKELMLFRPNVSYQFFFVFHVEHLETKNYKPGGKVNRFKKFDGGNLTKLLEDCIADAGAFDDSQTTTSTWCKKQGMPEHTEIWAWCLEDEPDPFDFEYVLKHLR